MVAKYSLCTPLLLLLFPPPPPNDSLFSGLCPSSEPPVDVPANTSEADRAHQDDETPAHRERLESENEEGLTIAAVDEDERQEQQPPPPRRTRGRKGRAAKGGKSNAPRAKEMTCSSPVAASELASCQEPPLEDSSAEEKVSRSLEKDTTVPSSPQSKPSESACSEDNRLEENSENADTMPLVSVSPGSLSPQQGSPPQLSLLEFSVERGSARKRGREDSLSPRRFTSPHPISPLSLFSPHEPTSKRRRHDTYNVSSPSPDTPVATGEKKRPDTCSLTPPSRHSVISPGSSLPPITKTNDRRRDTYSVSPSSRVTPNELSLPSADSREGIGSPGRDQSPQLESRKRLRDSSPDNPPKRPRVEESPPLPGELHVYTYRGFWTRCSTPSCPYQTA